MFGLLIGAFLGYNTFSPVGLGLLGMLTGGYIGKKFDSGITINAKRGKADTSSFYQACFASMGYIAKADGIICEKEINAAEQIMKKLRLNKSERKEAIAAFNRGKQKTLT